MENNIISESEVKLFASKKEMLKLMRNAILLLIASVLFLLFGSGIFSSKIRLFPLILGAAGTCFCLVFLFITIKKYNSKEPVLIMNSDGLLSRMTPVAAAIGLIKWEDITRIAAVDVQLVNTKRQPTQTLDKGLSVFVKNPGHYLEKIKNPTLKNTTQKSAFDEANYGRLIFIPASELGYSISQLEELVLTTINQFAGK